MYLEDLSQYRGYPEDGDNLVAIGWLSRDHVFNTGEVSNAFRKSLELLCQQPIRKMRGFHPCPFCVNRDPAKGNGEIHVGGADRVFVAPALVGHYVAEHGYAPPAPFIEAVICAAREPKAESTDLAKRIAVLADYPTDNNRVEFYLALLNGRVGIRVPHEGSTIESGQYVTNAFGGLRIPVAESPSGEKMLLVLANIPWLHQTEPGSVFAELNGDAVLQMAKDAKLGIIVQVLGPGRQVWGGVPVKDVQGILTMQKGESE